ncbi:MULTISPECIES: glycine betaine ABC transporter substrate-binding protein [unclassified Pseudactinotalea]|uniref:glycine betaine ABC transporter substrate-binding protein n=1 Tax=Micrococcales TaxID=85006 RepID=UPI003C7CE3C7
MRTTSPRRTRSLLAVTAASALLLAACNGDTDTDDDGAATDNGADTEENGDENGAAGAEGPVILGILPDWTDGLSMGYLWQEMLQDQGYEVQIEEIGQAGPLYTAVAGGDYHVYPSAWPEVTHAEYMDTYGDDLEDLGHYYEGAVLTLAVPEYTEIDSIPELAENPDMFDGQVIGIEAGAGHMGVTANSVFPTYGLDENFTLVESSTAAMLTELSSAIDAEEDVVVTLWHPFWANAEYPVKDLEDPEQALGEPESLNFIANSEFSSEFPEVAEAMGNFPVLDNDQFGELEDLIVNVHEGDPAAGAREWIENNQDIVDSVFN